MICTGKSGKKLKEIYLTFAVTFGDPPPVNFYIVAFNVKQTRTYQMLLASLLFTNFSLKYTHTPSIQTSHVSGFSLSLQLSEEKDNKLNWLFMLLLLKAFTF